MKHPEYDKSKYDVWAWPNAWVVHWVVNPGAACNELLLGQRMPEVTLVDKKTTGQSGASSHFPCPHCGTVHPATLWEGLKGLGHWFGLVCPTCEKVIPCARNFLSLILLCITWPLWFYPARLLKPWWLKMEVHRTLQAQRKPTLTALSTWWILRVGGFWGGLLWVINGVIPGALRLHQHQPVEIGVIMSKLPLWLLAGLAWAVIMYLLMNKASDLKKLT